MTRPPSPIVLAGMMFSGKTTVGKTLADRLGVGFVDLDGEIVRRSGRTISQWFSIGEEQFRRFEREVLHALLESPGLRVIAIGGGTLGDPANLELCLRRSYLVYLQATVDQLAVRVSSPSGRPLLDQADDPRRVLENLLRDRTSNFRRAHLEVPIGDKAPEALAEVIANAYWTHHSG